MTYPVASLETLRAPIRYSMVGGPFGSKLVARDYVPDGVPVIRGANLPEGSRFSFADFVFVTEEKVQIDLFGNLAYPGDMVTQRGTLGQVGLIPLDSPFPRFVVSQSQMKLTVDRSVADPTFVYYALRSPIGQHEIRSKAITAGVPHINLALFQQLQIPYPPLPMQHKIAAILSTYDDLIENNNRRIRVLEEMTQRIYHEWFVEFRYPGYEEVPLASSTLGLLPRDWEVRTLGEVCVRVTDGAHASPPTRPRGMPMASVKDMTDHGLNLACCRLIEEDAFAALCRQDCMPLPGDVLISKDGAKYLDKVVRMYDHQEVVLLSSIAILRPGQAIRAGFLTATLRDPDTKLRLKGHVSGAAIPRVVVKDFKAFAVVLPPESLQDKFEDVVGTVQRTAWLLERSNWALRANRDLLLPQLIDGQIDLDGLNIEVPDAA